MKKILTLLAVAIPFLSFGQVEKGMFLVSGNLSYQTNDSGESFLSPSSVDVTEINIAPYVGYFVTPKIAVGVLGLYSNIKQTVEPANMFSLKKIVQESTNFGPFVRYYQPITEKFYFFAQADFSYGKGQVTQTSADPNFSPQKTQVTAMTATLRPALSYFISKHWAVEVILGSISYAKREYKEGTQPSEDMDGFAFNFITRGLSSGVVFTF